MGILDDAIKEHLDLKRQHGADESELKQLEDEAFGAAERPGDEVPPPDPFAEAPTEFMEAAAPAGAEAPADAPEAESPPAADAPDADDDTGRPQPRAEIADLQEPPSPPEPPEPSEPVAPTGPTTEEREAIAEQPTEMFDVEEELAVSQPSAPTDEQLAEEGLEEPRLAPVDPLAELDEGGEVEVVEPAAELDEEDPDDDFWNEQRLSDELDQALEAPIDDDDDFAAEPEPEPEPEAEPEEPEEQPHVRHDDEDVLEETPDFLEETPEDDQLWFEQKPPKDFDFDD